MVTSNPQDKYLVSKVMTASPQELTLMLYEGAIRFCAQAIKAIEEERMQDAHNSILKVENIITEFNATLDKEYEVSNNLEALYDYMNRRLTEANIKKDKSILEEIQGYLRELRDTWKEAMTISKVKNVVNQ